MAMLVLFGLFKDDAIYGANTSFPGAVYIHQVYGARMPAEALTNFASIFGDGKKDWGLGMYIVKANGAEFMEKKEVEIALKSPAAVAFQNRCGKDMWWSDFIL
jgi:hypothetical protein